jgi:esterase/lipase
VSLRVPGHGTSPAALAETSWRDWAEAVRIAAKGLQARLPANTPLVLFGFSNGGALCLDYTLDAIEDDELPRPDAIVLYSPMVGITPFAKITRLHHLIAWIPAFEKVRWSRIEEEIDPYKYSSWPTNASEQAFLLTSRLASRMTRLHRDGRASELPPVLTFQSVVDSTVSVPDLMRVLYDRVPQGASELVLFDLNRMPLFEDLLKNNNEQFIYQRLNDPNLAYRLTLVTTSKQPDEGMVAITRNYGEYSEDALGVSWPAEVFSLSHGGVPIPPDDPILGTREATKDFSGPNLGSIHLRGEHGVLRISESITMRLRYNPFHSVVEQRTQAWLQELLSGSER